MGMHCARGRGCKTPIPALMAWRCKKGSWHEQHMLIIVPLAPNPPGAIVPGSAAKGNLRSSSCPHCSTVGAEGAWHSPAVLGEAVLMEQCPAVMNHTPGLRVWAAMGWRCSLLAWHCIH